MTSQVERSQDAPAEGERVAGRYQLHEVLGRGGMACVYRASDLTSGRQVALKQLVVPEHAPERASVAALFEREFHILAQLHHPRVIAVYDYGLRADGSPYYTMELLDGGDLRDRAPLPWREACSLLFDVCSSLALLHSRRLLHRDISPRNIRCTRDGKAKLIDFGAMAPMSAGGAQVVGTPAFTPPETVHRLALDARADLYSLGATLYHALTGQLPYPARTFAEVLSAWNYKVTPPSERVPGIPAALDDLVLSLISLEPALRPQTAFDVMQRLAAIAELAPDESKDVSLAYLATPTLVGRAELLAALREKLLASRAARGAGLLIEGAAGVGRSRLLDACALEAKTLGMTVLRATASGALEPFATARGLTQHLLDALPSSSIAADFPQLLAAAPRAPANDNLAGGVAARLALKNFADPALDGEQLQQAISRFMLTVSRTHPLLIAVDDVHRIDQPSAAVLATLVDKARRGSVFVALTVDSAELANEVVDVLSRRCERLALEPLTRDQTHLLLGSLFGDVAHLDMLANEIYEVALGNPRQCMDMAQHLVDQQLIRYAAGTWTLPSRLSADDLPRSAADAMRVRIQRLSSLARFLGEAQALAYYDTFTALECRALLPEASSELIDAALSELLSVRALVTDGSTYSLANRVWTAAFVAGLDAGELERRHRALAEVYRDKSGSALIHHLFAGGLHEQGLDVMLTKNRGYDKGVDHDRVVKENVGKMIWCCPLAIDTALRLGRSARQVHEVRRWYFASSATTDDSRAVESARLWFQQLEHDSGLALFLQYTDAANPTERLTRALTDAHQRYLTTPEHERVYAVDEAIRLLAEYVVYSIATGGRTQNEPLLVGLAAILEPFAPLSPVLNAIWNNAIATYRAQCECHYEFARGLWTEVLEKLDALSGGDIQHIDAIRNAVAYAIGLMEAQLGLPSATSWAARLDHDPYQRVSALLLRRIVRLEQGDWIGADRLRRQAEVLSLQLRAPQMFRSLLAVELAACAKACDLVGIQHVIEQLKPLAARYPGWVPHLIDADARFHLVRGDLPAAKAGFERCIALTECVDGRSLCMAMWVASQAGLAETLLGMDRAVQARASASAALEVCEARQIRSHAYDLARMLALAEAKLGQPGAAERLEALIAEQLQLGVAGLRLGLSYEARAQIALWTGDDSAFHHYARLTAREYRYGARSPLGARYERLVNDAGRRGLHVASALGDFDTGATIVSSALAGDDVPSMVQRSMLGAERSEQRAEVALHLICDMRRSRAGHLYLVSGESLTLASSRGEAVPESLAALVHEYLVQEQNRSETMTMMATGNLLDELPDASSTRIGDTTYQFLLLSCVVDGAGVVAGVAAVVADDTRVRNLKQGQLLSALASQLATGDPGAARKGR
jgi:hypothetical protein